MLIALRDLPSKLNDDDDDDDDDDDNDYKFLREKTTRWSKPPNAHYLVPQSSCHNVILFFIDFMHPISLAQFQSWIVLVSSLRLFCHRL